MMSLSDLAKSRGVSAPTVSENLSRWRAQGAEIATQKKGRRLLVDADAYDRAKADAATGVKSTAGARRDSAIKPAYGNYAQEQARKIGFEAELKRLELEERLGNLIPREDLQKAAELVSEAVLRSIDHAVMRAEELHEAGARSGIAGTRVALKAVVRDVKTRCADALVRLSTPNGTATESDE